MSSRVCSTSTRRVVRDKHGACMLKMDSKYKGNVVDKAQAGKTQYPAVAEIRFQMCSCPIAARKLLCECVGRHIGPQGAVLRHRLVLKVIGSIPAALGTPYLQKGQRDASRLRPLHYLQKGGGCHKA
jgi:hypothetical protein